mgnify:CR=1 FL=1
MNKKQYGAATALSGGVFLAAQALQSVPGFELTAEIWDFIFWMIGAGGLGGGGRGRLKTLTKQDAPP